MTPEQFVSVCARNKLFHATYHPPGQFRVCAEDRSELIKYVKEVITFGRDCIVGITGDPDDAHSIIGPLEALHAIRESVKLGYEKNNELNVLRDENYLLREKLNKQAVETYQELKIESGLVPNLVHVHDGMLCPLICGVCPVCGKGAI